MDQPTPPQPEEPSCGNCCNSLKHPRGDIGRVLCTALPPQVVQGVDPRHPAMGRNIYPEMDASKLGCTVFYGVNAQLFHLLGQAVTLAAQSAANDDGKDTPEKGA